MSDIKLFIICVLISGTIGILACFIASIFSPVQIALGASVIVFIGLIILMILTIWEDKKNENS